MKNICENCQYFRKHYRKYVRKYIEVGVGHCQYPLVKSKGNENFACEFYIEKK